jgi:integrase
MAKPKLRAALTEFQVTRTRPPKSGFIWLTDGLLPSFGIRIYPSGRRAWGVTRRWGGAKQPTFRKVGEHPAMSLAEARAAARAMIEGRLGASAPVGAPHAPSTFSALVDQFLAHGLSRRGKPLRPATVKAYRVVLGTYARPLHGRAIEEIRRRDVAALLATVARDRGPATASLARSVLSRFWGYLTEIDMAEANVALGTPVYAIAPGARVLTDGELAAIWAATNDGSEFSTIVRLLLWTAARRGEVGGMRWSEFKDGVWTLPAERAKNARELRLPLPRQALATLQAHPHIVGKPTLFGSTSPHGFTRWRDRKADLDARLGFTQPWRLHDIRRTVETRMTAIGIARELIIRALNHGVPILQQVYDHADYRPRIGEALVLWASELARIVSQPQPAVVAMRS